MSERTTREEEEEEDEENQREEERNKSKGGGGGGENYVGGRDQPRPIPAPEFFLERPFLLLVMLLS